MALQRDTPHRDTLLDVLGEGAFGTIYEHHGSRERGVGAGRPSSAGLEEREKGRKNKRQSVASEGCPSHDSDEDWGAEKDLDTTRNVVKARRRLLVSRSAANTGNAGTRGDGQRSGPGLAALAAQAGTDEGKSSSERIAGHRRSVGGEGERARRGHDENDERRGQEDNADHTNHAEDPVDPDGADVLDEQEANQPSSSSPSSSPTPRKKSARKREKRSKTGTSRTRREASGVLINGKMVHSINGVPDEFLLDMASLPQSQRPKKCGQCGSCQNPMRKKACEVMRALGTNPPIPRGKNREKLLGSANSKKHVPRSYGTEVPDVTKLAHGGEDDEFTVPEFQRLLQALVETHPNINGYWTKVARKVGTKDEQACFQRVYQSDAYYAERYKPKTGANGVMGASGLAAKEDGEDGLIERVLRRRRIVDELHDSDATDESDETGGTDGTDGIDETGVDRRGNKGTTVDHARVRDLVEKALGELTSTDQTESDEF